LSVRIYEISKKWGIKSADLVDRCSEIGIEASSHMSALEDDDVRILAKDIVNRPIKPGKKKSRKETAAKKAAEKKAATKKAAKKKAPAKEKAAAKASEEAAGTAEAPAVKREAAEAPAPEEAAEAPAKKPEPEAAEGKTAEAPAAKEAGKAAEPAKEAEEAAARDAAKKKQARQRKTREQVERKAAVDEERLKEQMAEAARLAEKESETESRILRRIILPPRKKSRKKKRVPNRFKVPRRAPVRPVKPEKVVLQSPVDVKEFSQATGIKSNAIVRKLMEIGVMANVNQVLDDETVETLGAEFDITVDLQKGWRPEEELKKLDEAAARSSKVEPRPPVVALLGHVDHGKTSLLDRIRHSDVTSQEFGGITQHMGAYGVTTDSGHVVTFLDTPGHEAFTEMRARGANLTDIVILVVAADDGVMPQTVEAINHAKAANVPMVVAINKIDRPDSQPERVKRQMTNYGLVPEDWGGDVITVPVSAITGDGVVSLIEMVALQAEIMELKAPVDGPAIGYVIEARRTEGRGIVASVLVKSGTLRVGDIMVAGPAHGRLRLMTDERGLNIDEAGPSVPVEVSGFADAPDAGERFYVVEDLQKAREIASTRAEQRQVGSRFVRQRVSMENLFESMQQAGAEELNLVLKADVQGTLEVLNRTLADMSVPEVQVNVIHSGIGSINDSDVLLADASNAILVGFNVLVESSARSEAERGGIEIRTYNIIYRLIEEMKAALEDRLAPEIREVVRGHAEVRDLFRISKIGTIAGCRVTDGVIPRRASIRVSRDGAVVYEGQIENLKHFKEDVREVREGFECGIKIAGYDDIKVGDVLEAFETEEIQRKLS